MKMMLVSMRPSRKIPRKVETLGQQQKGSTAASLGCSVSVSLSYSSVTKSAPYSLNSDRQLSKKASIGNFDAIAVVNYRLEIDFLSVRSARTMPKLSATQRRQRFDQQKRDWKTVKTMRNSVLKGHSGVLFSFVTAQRSCCDKPPGTNFLSPQNFNGIVINIDVRPGKKCERVVDAHDKAP